MDKNTHLAVVNDLGRAASTAFFAASILLNNVAFPAAVEAKSAAQKIALVGKSSATQNRVKGAGSGTLVAMLKDGKELGQCPLKHTKVSAQISGYVAKVTVTQIFENTYKEPIEAIYTFPLSDTGAVDDMVMRVGQKKIHGSIKKRAEAQAIYQEAKSHGKVAALLDQERTNIFTQSVANIPAGEKVEVTLQYVETLSYDAGKFSFVFPTVVGPRFIPGTPGSKTGSGRVLDTDQVPDASRITPPVASEGTRSGHDISISVSLNAGLPISDIHSQLHEIDISQDKKGSNSALISLQDRETIPNKDFILTWNVAGDALKSGYLAHKTAADKSGYFTLMLVPPKRLEVKEVAPKEMIFLIDCSGSQSGAPLEKAKETLSYIVDHMNPQDTFQIIAFNNGYTTLFEKPQAVSDAMKARAQTYISALAANGGTWMAPAVEAACKVPADEHRLRIVTFMTDGFVGNDMEIVGMIRRLRETSRWFSFGTGNGVNRALIDGIAQEGGGEADYVTLTSSGAEVGHKFYEHISTPVLTDVKVDFGKLAVKDVFPKEVNDVWAERPLYFKGRYEHAGKGTVTLSGFAGGKPYTQTLDINLPEVETDNKALGSIWARAKVDRLMREDYEGAQRGAMKKELQDEIVETALAHHIMTQFTSFVAVDESSGGKPSSKTIVVPTEMADGVSREQTVATNMGSFVGYGGSGSAMGGATMGTMSYKRATQAHSYGSGSYGGVAFAKSSHANLAMLPGAGLAPPPPPMSSPVPEPSSPVRTMNGPAQNQGELSSTPIIRDFRSGGSNLAVDYKANKPVADKEDLEETKKDAGASNRRKLSQDLVNLLAQTASKGDDPSKSEVTISIKLSSTGDKLLAALKKLGLKVIVLDAQKKLLTARVTLNDLLKIAQFKEVLSIELSARAATSGSVSVSGSVAVPVARPVAIPVAVPAMTPAAKAAY